MRPRPAAPDTPRSGSLTSRSRGPATLSRILVPTLTLTLALAALVPPVAAAAEDDGFTASYPVEECSFSSRGANRFFSLEPGLRTTFEGEDEGEPLELIITNLQETELIDFVTEQGQPVRVRARVIEEHESAGGEVSEISRNFFARCRETGDVYYFGEEVDIYEDGEVVSHEGAWRAGVDGAQPGIMMPGTFLLGSRYQQETAPGIALDRAEHTGMGLEVEVPAGTFEDCVEVTETTPLVPDDISEKLYCPGVGLVADEDLELAEVDDPPPPAPPSAEWLTAPGLPGYRVQVRITSEGESRQGALVTDCDPETVCVSGAVPGRVEVLVRVPGPKGNGCSWPTVTKLTTSEVEVWIEQIATGQVNHYVVDGSSPGSSDLPGFFDRAGFCP